jgi:transcriptional regulator with XRE-family HTH domain
MSEAPVATLKEGSTEDLPLSVLLFHAAMNQHIAISEFAEQLGIGPISLRQFISGQTQRPRSRTLEVLANALDMTVDEVRYRSALRPTSAPRFAEWLGAHMDKTFSRARLTRETGISDGALRNYLSGQTLPDAHQAQRLAEVLNVEPLDMAKVLVADQTIRAGGETVPAPEPEEDENGSVAALHEMHMYALPTGNDIHDEAGQAGAARGTLKAANAEEEHLLTLWRQLHPQGRRATLIYIAGLVVEG